MPISPKFRRFIDDELSRAAAMAERTVDLTLAQLQQPREGMLSQTERQHYLELVASLKKRAPPFQREFSDALKTLVRSEIEGTSASSAENIGDLELMDEARVEIDIEVSRAAELIKGSADWELRELQTFTSTLAGQTHVSADTNPLGPLPYARALWQAACLVTSVPVQRGILLRIAAGVMSGELKKAWAAACTRLEEQGIEPGIYRTVVIPSGAAPRAPTFDVTRPGALESLLSTMPAGGGARSQSGATADRSRASHVRNPAFEQALMRLEDLMRRAATGPIGAPRMPPQLGEHRASLLASTSETVDRQIVDLLSRLFEAVLSDRRLPAPFRTVMARLQVSALRVALVDPGLLEAHDHPVWLLMNRIASAGETYSNDTDPRLTALVAWCDTLVDDMARAPTQDAQLYRQSLARLNAFLSEQLHEQQLHAQPAIDALTRAERREDLERHLSQRLTEQMVPIRTSAAIRRFVTGAWAKVLAETMLRHGEKVEPTVGYLKAVDELLWSLRLPDHPQSRKRLLALLPSLLQRIRDGMALIGLPEAERRAVLDELLAVHTEALRPGKGGEEPELTPQQIVQQLRDEALPTASTRPPFSESLIDLSSMETVPAEAMSGSGSMDDDPARRIDAMAPGDRYQLFLHGRWTRVQLLWRSVGGRFFLFAGVDPKRSHSVTRRALERLSEEGLMKPLDDVSLVQRAVDSLMRKLTLTQ